MLNVCVGLVLGGEYVQFQTIPSLLCCTIINAKIWGRPTQFLLLSKMPNENHQLISLLIIDKQQNIWNTVPPTFETDSSSNERSFFLSKLSSRLTSVFPFGVWGVGLTGTTVARFGWDIELNKPGVALFSGRIINFLIFNKSQNKFPATIKS